MLIQQLYPVFHRRGRAALQMGDAADVGRHHHLWRKGIEVAEFAVTQRHRQLGVQHRVSARRAATQMRFVGGGANGKTQFNQRLLDTAFELLTVLQRAGRVVGDGRMGLGGTHQRAQQRQQLGQEFADIAGQGADALGFGGVGRIVAQHMTVLFHRHAAARGIHHHRFNLLLLNQRPPRIDVRPHLHLAAVLVVQVKLHRPAAARLGRDDGFNAARIQHAGSGAVDVGTHGRLHAARQHQHLAGVCARGPDARVLGRGHFGFQAGGQEVAHQLAQFHGRAKQRRGQAFFQRRSEHPLTQGTRHLGIDHFAPNVDQMSVLHPAGARAFAVATGQAAVEVLLRAARGGVAFHHLFDEVDAPAWAVQLIAQQLISRTGGGAKTAMHAFAQNGFGLLAFGRALVLGGELGLHGESTSHFFNNRRTGGPG